MTSDSLVALVPTFREYASKLVAGVDHGSDRDSEVEMEDRLVPTQWVLWGIPCCIVIGILLVRLIFGNEGIKPWATLLSFGLGALLAILGYVTCPFPKTAFNSEQGFVHLEKQILIPSAD